MRRAIPLPEQPPRLSASHPDGFPAPSGVFYVVQATAGAIGKRHRRVRAPLYETRHRAQIELIYLETSRSGNGTRSIWKARRYVQPAEWLYDVVVADGSVVRLGDRNLRRRANRRRLEDRERSCE